MNLPFPPASSSLFRPSRERLPKTSTSPWTDSSLHHAISLHPLKAPPTDVTLTVPASKSATNRALLCAGFAQGESHVEGILRSDDSYWCLDALHRLGIKVTDSGSSLQIQGSAPLFQFQDTQSTPVYLGSAGTLARFLTPILALAPHHQEIPVFASEQLNNRPLKPLLQALLSLGCHFTFSPTPFSLPFVIHNKTSTSTPHVQEVSLSGDVSSQFFSGLLMGLALSSSPNLTDQPTKLRATTPIVQKDYVQITLDIMRRFGAQVEANEDLSVFTTHPTGYRGTNIQVEADASTASYFSAMAALFGCSVTLTNLSRKTLQPDIAFLEVLEALGCSISESSKGITIQGPKQLKGNHSFNLQPCSDVALTLAAIAPFADGPIHFHGVEHIRHHECDRLAAGATTLRAFGVDVTEHLDGLTIQPCLSFHSPHINSYDDHRMVMAFSLTALKAKGAVIHNPQAISKTCPDFFKLIRSFGALAFTGSQL